MVFIENNLNFTVKDGDVGVHHINSMDFYNILQDISSNKLIIDIRDQEIFNLGHVRCAINIHPPSNYSANELQKFNMAKYIGENVTAKHWNLIFNRIVLYSDKPFFYNIDDLSHATMDTIPNVQPLSLMDWDESFLNHMVSRKKKTNVIYVYQGGYDSFYKEYPFMCGKSKISFADLYPSEIIKNFLYLGGKENAEVLDQLKNLKITHIVNMAVELDDFYPHQYKYYRANLEDRYYANIHEHFQPIIDFIEDAKK